MLYLALALVAVLAVTVVAFSGFVRSILRQHARERDLLLNQLLHAAGRTWTQPPSASQVDTAPATPEPPRYVASPEQWPGDDL